MFSVVPHPSEVNAGMQYAPADLPANVRVTQRVPVSHSESAPHGEHNCTDPFTTPVHVCVASEHAFAPHTLASVARVHPTQLPLSESQTGVSAKREQSPTWPHGSQVPVRRLQFALSADGQSASE